MSPPHRDRDEFLYGCSVLGVPGIDWIGEREGMRQAFERFVEAGATPCGLLAAEALRIEKGVPVYGVDLTEKNLPVESGFMEGALSYDKGCYVGQEIIARLRTYGTPARRLCGLRYAGSDDPPAPGTEVRVGTDLAGRTTSSIRHPRLGIIGLALLRRGFYERPLDVEVGDDSRKARTADPRK